MLQRERALLHANGAATTARRAIAQAQEWRRRRREIDAAGAWARWQQHLSEEARACEAEQG